MKHQEYIYYFKDGGWNSEYAVSKPHAVAKAEERWKAHPNLEVDRSSFKLRCENENEYNHLLSLFW